MGSMPTDPKGPVAPSGRQFRFEAWFVVAMLVVGFDVIAWVSWDLKTEQVMFLGIGSTALLFSGIVWRYGIIGYYHREGFGEPPVTEVAEAPLPRELLAPLLILIGIGFVLAGTPTGVGHALGSSAHAAVMLYQFGKEAYETVVAATVWAAILAGYVVCIVRRDRELFVGMVVMTALLGLVGGIFFLSYRSSPDAYQRMWDDYLEPFRFVVGVFI
jgi:hypothetical protein